MEANKVEHIGVIMDGNRRWANKNKLGSVLMGHEKGVRKLMELCDWCLEREIPYLSVYAFSTENWNRNSLEIDGLFRLMEKFFHEEVKNCIEKGIRIKVVGDHSMIKEKQRMIIANAQQDTMQCNNLTVQIALSYGGRNEIKRAMQKIVKAAEENKLRDDDITENVIEKYLDTAGIPMIDMVIRTGGNHRLSNFFPWQSAYAELYFTDTLWPEFSKKEFMDFIDNFENVIINHGA